MTDMEQTFIRSAITEVLPDLPEMTKDILEETLQSLGVETYEDFQFVNEADLLSALRPIQARKVLAAWKLRCQTPESSSSSVGGSPGPSASLMSYSPRSSSSTSSDSCKRPDIDWMDSFVIPWDKFPEELMQTLERGKRPSPQMRREMQLQNRIENVKRSTTPKIRKRKNGTDESDTDEVPPEQRAAIQDTYGCIKWDLKFLPLGETEESQQEKKEKLRVMSKQTDVNPEEVKLLMKSTFYTQRKQVNQGTNIKSLLQEWPFWFDDLGMAVHFKELTGSELQETFTRNLDLKGNDS
ncbi:30S ribosomal protein S5 [Dissostichus eleginoides]|uniref:30S ribosomal protein S5 n=1 Tax=Dissostichus eleginoides TaxID=100907 RepID=A0AAD9C776_DISEL|nr:30S ribosomal protein S5 [Dissostichus eleginoides]